MRCLRRKPTCWRCSVCSADNSPPQRYAHSSQLRLLLMSQRLARLLCRYCMSSRIRRNVSVSISLFAPSQIARHSPAGKGSGKACDFRGHRGCGEGCGRGCGYGVEWSVVSSGCGSVDAHGHNRQQTVSVQPSPHAVCIFVCTGPLRSSTTMTRSA